ncbi:hypothetical protein NP493_96g11004 [Ridgeia piscesae]|uniref:Uncharacterized protein n=1 Tax=Ridgeia piscesae TaxID=27915 RepID=A0AAD9UHW7_RIDPI|nr:hypothetical protein NP493_96g11004 [Ridgeia piscesae]
MLAARINLWQRRARPRSAPEVRRRNASNRRRMRPPVPPAARRLPRKQLHRIATAWRCLARTVIDPRMCCRVRTMCRLRKRRATQRVDRGLKIVTTMSTTKTTAFMKRTIPESLTVRSGDLGDITPLHHVTVALYHVTHTTQ